MEALLFFSVVIILYIIDKKTKGKSNKTNTPKLNINTNYSHDYTVLCKLINKIISKKEFETVEKLINDFNNKWSFSNRMHKKLLETDYDNLITLLLTRRNIFN